MEGDMRKHVQDRLRQELYSTVKSDMESAILRELQRDAEAHAAARVTSAEKRASDADRELKKARGIIEQLEAQIGYEIERCAKAEQERDRLKRAGMQFDQHKAALMDRIRAIEEESSREMSKMAALRAEKVLLVARVRDMEIEIQKMAQQDRGKGSKRDKDREEHRAMVAQMEEMEREIDRLREEMRGRETDRQRADDARGREIESVHEALRQQGVVEADSSSPQMVPTEDAGCLVCASGARVHTDPSSASTRDGAGDSSNALEHRRDGSQQSGSASARSDSRLCNTCGNKAPDLHLHAHVKQQLEASMRDLERGRQRIRELESMVRDAEREKKRLQRLWDVRDGGDGDALSSMHRTLAERDEDERRLRSELDAVKSQRVNAASEFENEKKR
jgi:DNA repair exonuclease SbcCD ATPase subunit